MIRSLTILAVMLNVTAVSSAFASDTDGIPYISPGVGISWNFGSGLVFAPKVSLGYLSNGSFVNLTVAIATCSTDKTYPLYVFETQYGAISKSLEVSKTQLLWGGGIGIALHSTDQGVVVRPKISAFVGFLVFLNIDLIFMERTRIGIGPEFVLPIPLRRISLG